MDLNWVVCVYRSVRPARPGSGAASWSPVCPAVRPAEPEARRPNPVQPPPSAPDQSSAERRAPRTTWDGERHTNSAFNDKNMQLHNEYMWNEDEPTVHINKKTWLCPHTPVKAFLEHLHTDVLLQTVSEPGNMWDVTAAWREDEDVFNMSEFTAAVNLKVTHLYISALERIWTDLSESVWSDSFCSCFVLLTTNTRLFFIIFSKIIFHFQITKRKRTL